MSLCSGILISEGSKVMLEREFTLEHGRLYHRWSRDSISHAANYKAKRQGEHPPHETPDL
jgi:hypothetical protein